MEERADTEWIAFARQKLKKGFYSNNLSDLAKHFREMSISTKWHSVCFILYEACLAIVRNWDERPVTVQEAKKVETILSPAFFAVLDTIELNPSPKNLLASMDELVLALQALEI